VRWRPLAGRLGLALASSIATVAVLEAGLRLADYRFSPVVLVEVEGSRDFRAFHVQGDPLVLFDPGLFWRPNPAAWADMDEDGLRGRSERMDGERLIVAIGDSNTIGAPGPGEHWTADLQDLLDRNAGTRPVRVLNAGCVGWTSLQGLRRFRQVLDRQPAVVFFSFGANEAHRVVHTDAEYARRADWLRRVSALRLAPPVAHRAWTLLDRDDPEPSRPRVSPEEHRRHLEELVDAARARSVVPVLLTRPYVGRPADPDDWMASAGAYRKLALEVAAAKGVPGLDVFGEFQGLPELFEGESHFNRRGRQRMAALLLRQLKALGHVPTDHLHASAVEPGRLADTRPELARGWWAPERWAAGGSGRWTSGEAVLLLERRAREPRLDVELSLFTPRNRTEGRIEVNGRVLATVAAGNGPWRRSLDISSILDRELAVRFVTDTAFVPGASPGEAGDRRTLGVFVHAVRLGDAPAE
jgi:lysophospholipase L1-like esterase